MVQGKRSGNIHVFFVATEGISGGIRKSGGVLRRGSSVFNDANSGQHSGRASRRRAKNRAVLRSGYGNDPGNHSGDTIMLNDFDCSCPVYIACGYTDLRRGIDGLAGIVQSQFQMDPFQRSMFLFCGRKGDRLKALYWEGDGFLLLYKRLEQGSFQWPRTKNEVQALTPRQYRWLMEGLSIEQPKAHKPVTGLRMI